MCLTKVALAEDCLRADLCIVTSGQEWWRQEGAWSRKDCVSLGPWLSSHEPGASGSASTNKINSTCAERKKILHAHGVCWVLSKHLFPFFVDDLISNLRSD